jgi:hypothetical protein
MDELRARAYLDLLLGRDSRPGKNGTASPASGFAGRVTLTVPLATLAWPAGRPGEIPGIGPEVRELAVLRDGRRAPRGTASRNLYYPCCFRDSSEIRPRPASSGPAPAARRGASR